MATSARADPCHGRLPSQPNQQFSSTVRYVGDGDSLCVGTSHDPATWLEVRLADFDAAELIESNGRFLKSLLQQVASSQTVNYEGRSGRVIVFDQVIAVCGVRGRSIGDLLRAQNAPEGGN